MVQISDEDVQRIRESVERHAQRRRPEETIPIQYVGGPLDGLTDRTTAYAATCRYVGWCVEPSLTRRTAEMRAGDSLYGRALT